MPLSLMRSATENKEVTHEKKSWTHEIPTKKNWDPRNTQEKVFWAHEITTSKNFGLTKYPRRHDGAMALNPRDP